MHALFANLTKADFQIDGGFVKREQARLYALAELVWDEVHRTDGPRSETQIRGHLVEMESICKRKRMRRS